MPLVSFDSKEVHYCGLVTQRRPGGSVRQTRQTRTRAGQGHYRDGATHDRLTWPEKKSGGFSSVSCRACPLLAAAVLATCARVLCFGREPALATKVDDGKLRQGACWLFDLENRENPIATHSCDRGRK